MSSFFYCCQERNNKTSEDSNNIDIDSLLYKANSPELEKSTRLEYANKAYVYIHLKKNDSTANDYLLQLAGRYYNVVEFEKYLEISREAYQKSIEINNPFLIAKSLSYIGDYHYAKFKNDSAYYYYSKSEKVYSNLKNKEDVNRLKLYKANILLYEKDFSGCEAAIIDILKSKEKKDSRLIYDCYISLGNTLEGLNDNEKALEYYNKAFKITDELKQDPQYLMLKVQTYNFIGRVYQKQDNHIRANEYFKKGLKLVDSNKLEPFLYANLVNNLGYSNFKLKNKIAIVQLNEALQIRENNQNPLGIVTSKINLSEYYLAQKDTAKAFAYSNEAKNMAHANKIFEDELKTLELLTQIDPKNDAVYNNRFIKLTDSLQNNERAVRNKFARIEFETNEIISQKNTIEAEKNKISSQRWIILGFSAFAVLVFGLLYVTKMQHAKNKALQYEQDQQKANEEIYQLMLDQQGKINEGRNNEKKRISQELHDGVMSRLTSTRLNLFILSRRTDEETIKKCLAHIADIQNIEKEIRAISHDLSNDMFTKRDSFKMIIEQLFEDQKDISIATWHLDMAENINWETIESNVKMHVYRIFQEALQNIHKYAQARNIATKILKHENKLHIAISDDGIGFDTQKNAAGIGLRNMTSRIKTIGGELHIDSQIGKGTIINLIIPI